VSADFYCDEALSGRTPVEVVAETNEVLAFRHTRPFWPVHIVVIPKRHVPKIRVIPSARGYPSRPFSTALESWQAHERDPPRALVTDLETLLTLE
jgi:hypothetical protein